MLFICCLFFNDFRFMVLVLSGPVLFIKLLLKHLVSCIVASPFPSLLLSMLFWIIELFVFVNNIVCFSVVVIFSPFIFISCEFVICIGVFGVFIVAFSV